MEQLEADIADRVYEITQTNKKAETEKKTLEMKKRELEQYAKEAGERIGVVNNF